MADGKTSYEQFVLNVCDSKNDALGNVQTILIPKFTLKIANCVMPLLWLQEKQVIL